MACLDQTRRRLGGAPTYLLTDNAKTVTVEHVAGIPIRHPEMVAVGRHYGCKVETCVAYDPQSKGGVEATVKLAKADLVPTSANLLEDYPSFTELVWACERFCEQVNHREHRETRQTPWSDSPPSASTCMCSPPSRTPWRWARIGWSRRIRRSAGAGCAIRPRRAGAASRSGAASLVRSW